MADFFDKKYGAGASAQVLGGQEADFGDILGW